MAGQPWKRRVLRFTSYDIGLSVPLRLVDLKPHGRSVSAAGSANHVAMVVQKDGQPRFVRDVQERVQPLLEVGRQQHERLLERGVKPDARGVDAAVQACAAIGSLDELLTLVEARARPRHNSSLREAWPAAVPMPEEVRTFWRACDGEGAVAGVLFGASLATGRETRRSKPAT